MSRSFWVPLTASFGTMILLYFIGFIADIDIFTFKISPSYSEISFLPIIVGFLIGFICERIIKNKTQNHEN
ncbi:ATPase [Bacillus dakarensis]|uniref:ATPase n=1 Tax=Robertmurraya dakarensis TaxID=1926278 RepID=UPI000980FD74|nr:ATPase [Bacillus dakarensis]